MPYSLEITPTYTKRLIKFLKKHQDLKERYYKVITLLEADPYHPSLRLHKLSGKLNMLHSVSLNMQYRITMEFTIVEGKITPINIGTHEEVY
jgi:mRNA-degrading endonuclease YafQ of YafQ-DinJ toxin-antitoxin module